MADQIEWDIDANLPLYTRDFIKHLGEIVLGYRVPADDKFYHPDDVEIVQNYGANPPLRLKDRDDQPTDIFSPEYDAWFRRHYDIGDEALTPREEFEKIFGPISSDQWQWLKEFVQRHETEGGASG